MDDEFDKALDLVCKSLTTQDSSVIATRSDNVVDVTKQEGLMCVGEVLVTFEDFRTIESLEIVFGNGGSEGFGGKTLLDMVRKKLQEAGYLLPD